MHGDESRDPLQPSSLRLLLDLVPASLSQGETEDVQGYSVNFSGLSFQVGGSDDSSND